MISYGIMQGRLTLPQGRGIQFFPFENWKAEFATAQEIGLQEIEWIFDYDRYEKNPIWTLTGRNEIKSVIGKTGIQVKSVCFDYFMRRPFYKYKESERTGVYRENLEIAYNVIEGLSDIGGRLLEIPMVDASTLKTEEEEKYAVEYVEKLAVHAAEKNIKIGLETDLEPGKFTDFLNRIKSCYVYANFDSGNSSGIGYEPNEEIPALGNRIYNVHIKDRVYKGSTVALGTGSADFDGVFKSLKDVGYKNSIILQAARGEDGFETETIKEQLNFVKTYIKKYSLQEEEG